ncbi:hypothetical protein HGRIS_004546 [Hohenbuehelia grisea]|uniref:Uncharacterized protein n=1 Tax=Hohenbuehelia grisea TaxID=104357 RepID=A0ABR3JC67_9AGAR
MNRPRESILALFDPLKQSSSPPKLGYSDKENATPVRRRTSAAKDEHTLTAFFSRTYKLQPENPPVCRRRLVDIGDATVDEIPFGALSIENVEEEEETEDMSFCTNDEDITVVLPAELLGNSATRPATISVATECPRTPLAEMGFDQDLTPVPRSRFSEQPIASDFEWEQVNLSAAFSLDLTESDAPDTPQVIPNAHLLSYTSQADTPSDSADECAVSEGSTLPDSEPLVITVSPPDTEPPSSSPSQPCSTISDAAVEPNASDTINDRSKAIPRLTPRFNSREQTLISVADDPRRVSVDLQQSFCLQLQCPESSFDLLNDKVSFFASNGGSGMETFLNDDDESFDLEIEAAKMKSALQKSPERAVSNNPAHRMASPQSRRWPSPRTDDETSAPPGLEHIVGSGSPYNRGTSPALVSLPSVSGLPVSATPKPNTLSSHLPAISEISIPASRPKASLESAELILAANTVFRPLMNEQFDEVDLEKPFFADPVETPKHLPTTLEPPACPVPALRIVKRSKLQGQQLRNQGGTNAKQDLPSAASFGARATPPACLSSYERSESNTTRPLAMRGAPATATERLRPEARRTSPPNSKLGHPGASAASNAASLHSMAGAARRVPITDSGHGVGANTGPHITVGDRPRTLTAETTSRSATSMSRRIPAISPSNSSLMQGKETTGVRGVGGRTGQSAVASAGSGLRQPSTNRYGSAGATTSALPRLVSAPSRLPGPATMVPRGLRTGGGFGGRGLATRRTAS